MVASEASRQPWQLHRTGSGTCADLAPCCDATMASLKTTCQAEYNSAVGSGDVTCGRVLSLIKPTFCP